MKLLLPITLIVSLFFANNVEARWKPTPGMTWNYVLGAKVNIAIEKAQVLDIDYQTPAARINEYHRAGKKIICYFSGGTIEKNRNDYRQYTAVSGLVRNTYGDWPNEKWLDFRKEGIKPLIRNRMRQAINNRCDAIEVDNLDGYQIPDVTENWSNPLTKSDTIKFARWLGATAHEMGISIGLKNVPGILPYVSNYFDFAINESCVRYRNECALYKNFVRSGKPVFGITYGSFSHNLQRMCTELNGVGISMIVKANQDLVQAMTIFDGKKHCGSSFKYGYSYSSSSYSSSSRSSSSHSSYSHSSGKKVVSRKTTKKIIII